MKVIFDSIIFSLQKQGGISIYWKELSKRFSNDKTFDFENILYKNSNNNPNYTEISYCKHTNYNNKIFVNLLRFLPFIKKIKYKTIFHSSYQNFLLSNKAINVITIHDLGYERKISQTGLRRLVNLIFKYFAIINADGIICISEFTKNELLKFYKLKYKKINVIYNGVSNDYFVLQKKIKPLFNFTDKYILYVGTRYKYKQFSLALDVMNRLPNYYLVIAGGPKLSDKEKELIEKKISLKYHHFESPTTEELNNLYNHSHALLYLSKYEGFGIPLVEAMKSGCPFIGLTCASIPEISGPAGILIDDNSDNIIDEIVNAIKNLEEENYRNKIIEIGIERSKLFSWNLCFEKTKEFYLYLYNNKN